MLTDPSDAAIVFAVISMANGLKLRFAQLRELLDRGLKIFYA